MGFSEKHTENSVSLIRNFLHDVFCIQKLLIVKDSVLNSENQLAGVRLGEMRRWDK